MIRVSSLGYTYPPALPGEPWQVALDGVSFEVAAGSCLAITGPNNSGKSTLCLAVAGLAPRLTSGAVTGRIEVAGQDVQAAPPGALADMIGVVLQDPAGQLFNPTVEDEIAWGLENLGLPPGEMPTRIAWALQAVGLDDVPLDQPPQTLSGGQQKRLALAAALALQPRVLVLDEPAGGLAPAGRAEMVAVLRDLRSCYALTILFAENDPAIIAALADEVLLLENGRPVQQDTPARLYPALVRRGVPAVHIPPASQFAAAANARRDLNLTCLTVEQAIEQIREYPLNGHTAATAPATAVAHDPDSSPAIVLRDLSFAYHPARPVLHSLNLTIPAGQLVTLTGDNGAGKTTLARHLIGLLRPTSGSVLLFGEDTSSRSIGQLARLVGFAFQNPEVQIFNPTVWEEVAFGPRNLGAAGDDLDEAVARTLDAFDLTDLADYPPAVLSFSARRMVALASIAVMNTPILVLDEPTVGLDAAGQARLTAWLKNRRKAGATIVLITHDMELAASQADRLVVLEQGCIAADGAPAEVFSRPDVLRRAGLEAPFAVQLAAALNIPGLAADLTPQGAAQAWLERLP